MPTFARDGYAFYSVITPSVFSEAELPKNEVDFSDEEEATYQELAALAEQHGTTVHCSPYQRG